MLALNLLIAALLLAGLACGESDREKDAIEEAEEICFGLTAPGTTVTDAGNALRGAYGFILPAPPCDLLPLESNDACAPAEGDGRCAGYWYFFTNTVCGQAGCCGVCEVRVLRSDVSQNGVDAAVCGSRFYRRQPCI